MTGKGSSTFIALARFFASGVDQFLLSKVEFHRRGIRVMDCVWYLLDRRANVRLAP